DDGLAAGGEAEMPGLDDPRVNRTDRDLMKILALSRKERVRRRLAALPLPRVIERVSHVPPSMIQPGALVRRAVGRNAEKVVDGAFQADRWRMNGTDRGEPPRPAVQAQRGEIGAPLVEQRHVNGITIAPQPEQCRLARGKRVGG